MATSQTTTIPNNGSGTINIHINNPSVNSGSGMPQYGMPPAYYPVYYPYYCYPANYYMGHLNNGGINQTTTINGLGGTNPAQATQQAPNPNSTATSTAVSTIKQPEKKPQQREIVVLTDNYVKTLENYLRSNNIELRKSAIKEVLERFKEDKSRVDNPSLTALLNIGLQDSNSIVRAVAMTALEAGYAKGDKLTEQILGNIQKDNKNFSTDAIQAADSLLQMSKTKKTVNDNSHSSNQQIKKGA